MQINWLGVLIAGVAAFVLSMLWYTVFFRKLWMTLSKIEPSKTKENQSMTVSLIVALISYLVTATILAMFLKNFMIVTIIGALIFSFFCWLAFVATVTLDSVLWEKKPVALYILNNSCNLLSLWLIALILTVIK